MSVDSSVAIEIDAETPLPIPTSSPDFVPPTPHDVVPSAPHEFATAARDFANASDHKVDFRTIDVKSHPSFVETFPFSSTPAMAGPSFGRRFSMDYSVEETPHARPVRLTEHDRESVDGRSKSCCRRMSSQASSKVYRTIKPIIDDMDLQPQRKVQIMKHFGKSAIDSFAQSKVTLLWGQRLNIVTLVGGMLVSGLLLVQHTEQVAKLGWYDSLFWIVVSLSIVNNIATGFQQLFNLFELAKVYDEAYAKMMKSFWSYATNSGQFKNKTHEEGFHEFCDLITKITTEESENVRAARLKARNSQGDAANKQVQSESSSSRMRTKSYRQSR